MSIESLRGKIDSLNRELVAETLRELTPDGLALRATIPRDQQELGRRQEVFPLRIFWMPHPEWVLGDELRLPYDRISLMDGLYKWKNVKRLYPEFIKDNLAENGFLKWLESEEETLKLDQVITMSCVDFVYATLFQSHLVSKEKLKLLYKLQILEQTAESYYGFDLTQFQPFDPVDGEGEEGDLLIAFNGKGEPVHTLFLGPKTEDGWDGTGLWNIGSVIPTVNRTNLQMLQIEYERNSQGEDQITFKHCSLNKVI